MENQAYKLYDCRDMDVLGNKKTLKLLGFPPLSHAYLLLGAQGTGKAHIAYAYAKKILCEKHEPCGNCKSCKMFAAGTHPDFLYLDQEKKSIGIDEVRQLAVSLTLTPHSGDYVVVILSDADRLTVEGQNALLKGLEEPNKSAVLILTAENEDQLLPTVVSRCQKVEMIPMSHQEIGDILVGRGMNPDEASQVARVSLGRPGIALSIVEAGGMKKVVEEVNSLLKLMRGDLTNRFALASEISKDPTKLAMTLSYLSYYLRDRLLTKIGSDDQVLPDSISNLDMDEEVSDLLHKLEDLHSTMESIAGSANNRLALESLFYRLSLHK